MRFVHSLAKVEDGERIGWCAPVELGESAPHYIGLVVPMEARADDRYICEVVRITCGGRVIDTLEIVREGEDAFLLNVGQTRLWFTARPSSSGGGPLPYVGCLEHPDFSSLFAEIEPEDPSRLDQLCESEDIIVVGCDPFTRYSGIERLMQRPVG
jgi:hypothetical protein